MIVRPFWAYRVYICEVQNQADAPAYQIGSSERRTSSALPPQRMAAPDLMGELSHFLALPSYQLALPFLQGFETRNQSQEPA
jgi:hypothetical protein